MDLTLLNDKYKRSKLIEDWSSLVWAERFSTNGDFELVSNDIGKTLELLPIGGMYDPPTLVAIEDSNVPMVVETHKIIKPKNDAPRIVTSGRSFETVLDRRQTIYTVESGVPREPITINHSHASMVGVQVATNIINYGLPTSLDAIPEINFGTTIGMGGPNVQTFIVEPKDLHTWLREMLNIDNLGLRASLTESETRIDVTVYPGSDISTTVVFDVTFDQFDDGEYVLSTMGSKNVMITSTKNGQEFSLLGPEPSGLSRRVDYQDLSNEISVPAGTPLTQLTVNHGKVALSGKGPIALFSGSISESVGADYKNKYGLGDIVTLQGDYGLSQKARVVEFIRTQDNSGYKAYPTFEALTSVEVTP